MQVDKSNDQAFPNPTNLKSEASLINQQPINALSNKHKELYDSDILPLTNRVIKNSNSYNNSLLNKLELSRSDDQAFPSQKGSKNIKQYRNSLTYLKYQAHPAEFIAYCIVNKQSYSGIVSHERLIVVDSHTKELKYYSQIPNLPIKKVQELGQEKQAVNIVNTKKFSVSPLKKGIGEVEISWMESGKLKKWNIKMGNSQVTKNFCYLIDSVKNNRYLKEKIIVKPPPSPSNKVNTSRTHFIAEVVRLEEKKESNRSKSNSIQQSIISRNQEEKEVVKIEEKKIEEEKSQEEPLKDVVVEEGLLKVPQVAHLEPKESIRSIKIQEIIKQAEEHSAPRQYKEPQHAPVVIKDYHSQYKSQYKKEPLIVPEIDKILKQRRTIQAEEQSITTIKHMHKEQQDLGMSKRLVMSIHRKLTNKEELVPNKEKEREIINLSQYYRSERPTDNAQNYRQTLLQERRYTELAQKQKQRKTYILNQHIYPRQQKSRSRSKDRQLSNSNILIQRDWLVKWLNAKDSYQKGEIYSKFVDHCISRVEKLTESFVNWHLFHKKAEEYIIKEDNIEFTYQMLSLEEKEENYIHEQEMINKMDNLNYMWRIVNELKTAQFKFAVPLACLVRYKGLKVYCKVQLASNSLRIEEIQDKLIYEKELSWMQEATKGLLRHYSLFLLASNQSKWLYINQVDIFLRLDLAKRYSISYSYTQKYVKNRKEYEVQLILLHLNKTVIPSFLNTMNQTQPLSTHDFQQLLKAHHLNATLLPLIFNKSIEMRTNKATKWIISQICSIFLQQEIRERMHSFLMKKQTNKSISKELFFIFAQSLRWNEENVSLNQRLKAYIDTDLSMIQEEIIDEYVISSLLHKLSLTCSIKNIPLLQVLQKREFSFWREFQFQPESIDLVFTSVVFTYDFRYFSERYAEIQRILKGVPSTKMSHSQFKVIQQKLLIPKQKDYRKCFVFKLLPLSLKNKIDQYNTFIKNTAKETHSSSRFPKVAYPINTSFYFSIDCFKFAAETANRYIKLKKFKECEGLIRAQLIRAWIWSRNRPNALILLYDLNTTLSIQRREQADSLSSCLKCLQLVLSYYQEGLVSITILMQKIFKAAQVHSIFNDHQQSLNLYRASHQIYENMLAHTGVSQQMIIKYMSIYYSVALLLMNAKRVDESIKQIKENLQLYSKWKEEMRNEKYEVLARIHSQQFQNYLLMFRCYELVGKKIEMLQIVQECSIKFIQNYVGIMVVNRQVIDLSYIPEYRFVEVVKNIWYAILLNCSSKNMTYQQYFSKAYSSLKLINLNSVRDVVIAIQKQCEGSLPFDTAKAMQMISLHIHQKTPKSGLEKLTSYTMSSIFVEQCIRCLKILSSSTFLEAQTYEQQQTNSKSLEFASCLLSLLGYEYSLGSFSVFSQSQQ